MFLVVRVSVDVSATSPSSKQVESIVRKANEMTKPRIPTDSMEPGSILDDAGLGNIRPEQMVGLDPRDAGLGNIRPEQMVGLDPRDAGLGNIRPEQMVGLDPRDAGLGNIRPEQMVGLDPRDAGLDLTRMVLVVDGSTLVRSQPPVTIGEEGSSCPASVSAGGTKPR